MVSVILGGWRCLRDSGLLGGISNSSLGLLGLRDLDRWRHKDFNEVVLVVIIVSDGGLVVCTFPLAIYNEFELVRAWANLRRSLQQ